MGLNFILVYVDSSFLFFNSLLLMYRYSTNMFCENGYPYYILDLRGKLIYF